MHMELGGEKANEMLFLTLAVLIAAAVSFAIFLCCFLWFRREQRRLQRKILRVVTQAVRSSDGLFVSGTDLASCGELVAQFKVNQGRQVVSLLEADGKRFLHTDGELSAPEREKMVRYLKSEGFMS